MLRQAFKIGIGNQFCSMWRSTHYILNILHTCLCWFCSVHTSQSAVLWIFSCGTSDPYFPFIPSEDCHITTPSGASLFFPPVFLFHFFFQIDLLSIFVSPYHLYVQILPFPAIKRFFSCQKFLFSKSVQEMQRCSFDWTTLLHTSLSVTLWEPECRSVPPCLYRGKHAE